MAEDLPRAVTGNKKNLHPVKYLMPGDVLMRKHANHNR